MRLAIVTGITGQFSSYLTEFLLAKNYRVIGVRRRASTNNIGRIEHLLENPNFEIIHGDITDGTSMFRIMKHYQPDEFYNTAAASQVRTSFEEPASTLDITGRAIVNILEALVNESPHTKLFQCSSSEQFGNNKDNDGFQRETTAFQPSSPYAAAKVLAHNLVNIYRKSYDIFACCGIMFNYESKRRGENFVTRKITKWLANYHTGKDLRKIQLGNIDSYRDWQHCKDVVRASWMILQHGIADDYVIASGETRSVRDFFQTALDIVNPTLRVQDLYEVNKALFRPYEVNYLRGDSSKIRKVLGWKPEVDFDDLVREMVETDISLVKQKEKREMSDR